MKIETQPLENRQVKVTAEFDAETLEEYKRRAARKISRDAKIPGFRPGKAPLDVVRRLYGEESIQQQAIEMLVDEMYPKMLDQAELKPSGPGALEEIISQDPPKFSFIIPLNPEVSLGDYRSVRVPYEPKAVTEEDIDEFLRRMRTNYATAEPVDRPAQSGDVVYVQFSGKLAQAAEGEESNVFPERPAQFIIDDETIQDRDWPFPNFAENLVGMKENDEKTVTHTFSAEHEDQALRDKEVEFQVKVQSVKSLTMPELNDDFAKTLGDFETMDDVRKVVREQLEHNNQEEYENDYFNTVMDKIVEQASIAYPPHMLEEEEEHIVEHLKEDLGRQGMDFDTYLKFLQKDRATYISDEVRPAARKRLERSLVIDQLAQAEEIKLTSEDYVSAIQSTQQQVESYTSGNKKERLAKNQVDALTYNALSRAYNQRVLDRLKAIASGQAEVTATEVSEPVAETAAAVTEEKPAKPAKKTTTRKKKAAAEETAEAAPASDEAKEE